MKKRLIALTLVAAMSAPIGIAAAKEKNTVIYDENNTSLVGQYEEPVSTDGSTFLGWATTKEKADAGEVDFTGKPEDKTNASLNAVGAGQTKTVYAVWDRYNAKYAVSVYGINIEYPDTITFGPASSKDSTHSTVDFETPAHIKLEDETDSNKCIHNHSWTEIIEQSKINPEVFEKCINAGCVKTVPLKLNNMLLADNINVKDILSHEPGDGPGALVREISQNWRQWNWDNSIYGGYPASRIRAVLNGTDWTYWTNDSEHGPKTNIEEAGDDITQITSENCLLSCFPQALQNAIIPKTVISHTIPVRAPEEGQPPEPFTTDPTRLEVTQDPLWLFSAKEIDMQSSRDLFNPYEVPNEKQSEYQRTQYCDYMESNGNVSASMHAHQMMFTSLNAGNDGSTTPANCWLRTIVDVIPLGNGMEESVMCPVWITGPGDETGSCAPGPDVNNYTGIAPGFIIGKNP